MGDELRSDLVQLYTARRHRPVPDARRQHQPSEEVPETVREREELQAHLIGDEPAAGRPGPLEGIFAFLDPLLGCPTLVVECHHVPGPPCQVGDYEADAGKQSPRCQDLYYDLTGLFGFSTAFWKPPAFPNETNGGIDVHALRHTFGTLLSVGGAAPRTAQPAMRHSTSELTMNIYADPRMLDIHGAVELLPTLPLDVQPPFVRQPAKATGTDKMSGALAPLLAPTSDFTSKLCHPVAKRQRQESDKPERTRSTQLQSLSNETTR